MAGDAVPSEVEALRRRVTQLEETLGTLIAWMGQSANSPISLAEVGLLLEQLKGR
jgi:hypothetical protein